MNLIRAGDSVFRTNSKILSTYAVTLQNSYCSRSKNDGNNKKEGDSSESSEKQKCFKSDHTSSKYVKLQKSRKGEGFKAFYDLLNSSKIDYREKKIFNVNDKKDEDNQAQFTTPNRFKTLNDLESFPMESHDKKTELPSKNVIKQRRSYGLLQKVKAAAVELGGDVEVTKNELLAAYRSVQGYPGNHFQNSKDESSKLRQSYSKEVQLKQHVNVFSVQSITRGRKLNIFTQSVEDQQGEPILKMWHQLSTTSLLDSSMQAPKNYFEQLILWTHHGKLWHFPIDNEQGMDQEKQVDFSDHVFLDKHLEPWCPKSGPLRHFMELVTVGLSKNPYLSVQQKKDHIMWYRDYFENKRRLLNELGVLDNMSTIKNELK